METFHSSSAARVATQLWLPLALLEMIQNRRQRFLPWELGRVMVLVWAVGKMAFVVMLAARVIRVSRSLFGCLLVTSDLNCRSLCSLCAPSSSCQHSPLDSEVSQLGDVHRPRKLDLHSLPCPSASSPLASLYSPWSEQTHCLHQVFPYCSVTLLNYYRFIQNWSKTRVFLPAILLPYRLIKIKWMSTDLWNFL